MAIIISDSFRLNSKQFLDERVGRATSLKDLLEWDTSLYNLPDGFEVWVEGVHKWYTYDSNNTPSETTGYFKERLGSLPGALPVYDIETYEELPEDEKPDEFIATDETTSEGNVSSTNLEILFSAIRKLQAEIFKLKNSFELGINSYNDTETASSRIMYDLDDVEEEEPLWAVQETELSEQYSADFYNTANDFRPESAVTASKDHLYLTVTGQVEWPKSEDETIPSGTSTVYLSGLTDPKLFLYLNTSEKDVVFHLKEISGDTSCDIDLKEYLKDCVEAETYSTLLCISRTTIDPLSSSGYGKSFVWMVVQELINNDVIFEKYINPLDASKSTDPIYLDKRYYLAGISLTDLKVSKLTLCSRYQDFSDEVNAVKPSELEDVKYRVAHLTIRSVDTVDVLDSIVTQLKQNELVYVTKTNALYIISDGKKHKIGSSDEEKTTDTMTTELLLKNLTEAGLISLEGAKYDSSGNCLSASSVTINKIAELNLINTNTNESYSYGLDSNGELVGTKQTPSKYTFENIIETKDASGLFDIDGDMPDETALSTISLGRGFIARMHGSNKNTTKDMGLNADRVKIGAFYIPRSDDGSFGCTHGYIELENTAQNDYYLDGCYLHYAGPIIGVDSNGNKNIAQATYHLALSGKIPAGGTYLVRCCRYAEDNNPTAFIKVTSYDKEWYATRNSVSFTEASGYDYSDSISGNLLDMSYQTGTTSIIYGFALTYGNSELAYNTSLHGTPSDTNTNVMGCVIDSCNMFIGTLINNAYWNSINNSKATYINNCKSNCLYKNTFELDPAKQAFQSYCTKDSSRLRGLTAADNQIVELNKEYIQFPNSDDVYPVSMYTPKASYECKNVSTDKTQIDTEKPNMVTCSFGIDVFKTRCFNWISVGDYDEYVWIRKQGDSDWTRFQSYWGSSVDSSTTFSRKEYGDSAHTITYGTNETTVEKVVYANPKYKNVFPGCNVKYTSHKCIIDVNDGPSATTPTVYEYIVGRSTSVDHTPLEGHCSDVQTFTIYPQSYTPVMYQITDQQGFHWIEYQAWAAAASTVQNKIEFDSEHRKLTTEPSLDTTYYIFNNTKKNYGGEVYFSTEKEKYVYGTHYIKSLYEEKDSHDSLVYTEPNNSTYYEITSVTITTDNKSEYWNGKKLIGDTLYIDSDGENKLTEEPTTGSTYYKYSEVNITDSNKSSYWSNDFNWKKDLYIKENCNVFPILINTGDMTQNGTRINEWLDYYEAGKCLFNHLEQMNVVGNNDLGNVDETALGTGDDPGKSNPHFYNIAYCYEIPMKTVGNSVYTPIIYTEDEPMYIPSLYYFETSGYTIYMMNSELTATASSDLFNSPHADIYTGFNWLNDNSNIACDSESNYKSLNSMTIDGKEANHYIYEDLYQWLSGNTKNKILCCHELPFTVVTADNLTSGTSYSDRSISVAGDTTGLIGSHCNRVYYKSGTTGGDTIVRNKGTYWLSRLAEYFDIKYFFGGHKHTYACTWPVREQYYYLSGGTYVNSLNTGPMVMGPTLSGDTAKFFISGNTPVMTDTLSNIYSNVINLTKRPIVSNDNYELYKNGGYTTSTGKIEAITKDNKTNSKYVVYFMLQATGFKLKSNKELPGSTQHFSQIIPQTVYNEKGKGTPSVNQIYPMFASIALENDKYETGLLSKLMAIENIVPHNSSDVFNQQTAINEKPNILYFDNSTIPYGTSPCWKTSETTLNLHVNN